MIQDVLFSGPGGVVENLSHGIRAACTAHISAKDIAQLLPQYVLDFPYHLRGGFFHGGQAESNFRLEVLRKLGNDGGSLFGLEVGQDQGRGLRMLVLQETEQLNIVDGLQEIKRAYFRGGLDAFEYLLSLPRAPCFLQNLLSVIQAPL